MSHMPGDVLSRRKGLVMHRGIALGNGQVLHNTPGRGEHVSSLNEFAAGRPVAVERRSLAQRERALERASLYRGGGRYRLLTNNCEHTTTRVTDDRARSPQLRGWLLGLGIAGATLAVTRHPGWAAAGLALGQRLAKRR
ncbi:MAG: lecithin retinol acyltransferase family protein [Pseudomonadota bacterium]